MLSLGLVFLFVGAELLVRGASQLAAMWRITPLVIGLTVIAFGTSLPELAVSVQGVLTDHPDLVVGNCIGSTIANLLLILGVCALYAPLIVIHQLIWLDVPIMIGAHLLLFLLSMDGTISRWDGFILLACLVVYNVFIVRKSRQGIEREVEQLSEETENLRETIWLGMSKRIGYVVVGLLFCVIGASWLVDSAAQLARSWGISELVIGLTIVAFGTSMPEAATSFVATLRGQREIAIGNAVGSCTFNVLGVIGAAALISPQGIPVAPTVLRFDMPIAIAATVACLPIFFTGHRISRWEGLLFLGYYGAYVAYLWLSAQKNESLEVLSTAVLWFAIPLTAVTLGVIAYREFARKDG
jgi:cation:H+ antiporter